MENCKKVAVDPQEIDRLIEKLSNPGDLDCKQLIEKSMSWQLRASRIDLRIEARKELLSTNLSWMRCIEIIVNFSSSYKSLLSHQESYVTMPEDYLELVKIIYFYEIKEDLKILKLAMIRGAQIILNAPNLPDEGAQLMRIVHKPKNVPKVPHCVQEVYNIAIASPQVPGLQN